MCVIDASNTCVRVKAVAGHTLTLDLQAVHMLALIELYQPAGGYCSNCAIEHSVDQKSWKLTSQVNSPRTSVAYGPQHQFKARYMQVRLTLL